MEYRGPEGYNYDRVGDILFHLSEECHELGKAASKLYRFGPNSREVEEGPTNLEALISEYEDVSRCYQELRAYFEKGQIRQLKSYN